MMMHGNAGGMYTSMFQLVIISFYDHLQISTRQTEAVTARAHLAEELEEEKQAEEEYEEMLRREAEKMKIDGFQPKVRVFLAISPPLFP
jgi:hypothetical protein